MLFAKRSAITEQSFLLPQPTPPLHFSLPVCYCVSSLHFFLFPSIILLSTCLDFFTSLYLSVTSFYARCLCQFLLLCIGRFLFFCFVVTSPLSSVFCHFLLSSCRFAHCHRHTNTDINKSSFCEVPEVRDECDFQNPQKKSLAQNIHSALFHLKNNTRPPSQKLKPGTSLQLSKNSSAV